MHPPIIRVYAWAAGLQAEIQAANGKFMDAFAKGDSEAIAALYTKDCKVMPTGSDVVEGQQGTT
jgi:ketosteroid isomerase-like protein